VNAAAELVGRAAPDLRNKWPAFRFAFGPGALVAVGYMDPGNWATDLGAGSSYGYALLSVVLLSSLTAMLLQSLAVRLGIGTGRNLAEACRAHYPRPVAIGLWILCQIAIVACDMAEIIGAALALRLLFGLPLLAAVLLGALGTLAILLLDRKGKRRLESAILLLSLIVGVCLFADVVLAGPAFQAVFAGLIPTTDIVLNEGKLLLAVGIIGATVMPHNLYLHSALVTHAAAPGSPPTARHRMRWAIGDSCLALTMAFFVNAAILVLAAAAFQSSGFVVADLAEAYHLLTPLLGTAIASTLFGLALLAAGQSATVTATMAGGIVAEGFLGLRFNPWLMRLITRGSALVPSVLVTLWAGQESLTDLLIWSQVLLSLQLPFAVFPLVHLCSKRALMGPLVAPRWLTVVATAIAIGLTLMDAAVIASVLEM
jgi:manganese transport protein